MMSSAASADDVRVVPLDEDSESHLGRAAQVSKKGLPLPAGTRPFLAVWGYTIAVAFFHLLLPLAFVPWLFSWTGLLLIPIGNYIFCSLGIGAGYHRLLTHRSYRCKLWLEHLFALFGVCSLQDSPARWVVVHRVHHQHSDREPDPHSPLVNFFWGHMGWLFVQNRPLNKMETYDRYARDVLRDPFYMWLERGRMWIWIYVVHAILFFLAGLAIGWASTGNYMGGVQFGSSLLLYGVIFRTIYTWHVTWAVNSVSHAWGYRNYETDENSRNNWIVALATNGEGWHNNHHADPRSAAHGFHKIWELDVTYLSLRALAMVGLVWDIVPRRRQFHGQGAGD
jgi:stearoyl-CoA desaturase (delta-9 desaturase)